MKKIFLLTLILLFQLTSAWGYENPVILQSFYWYIPDPDSINETPESNLWNYIAENKAYEFKEDGFTHVWLPPTGKAFSPDNNYNVGYAVYDHYDLGEFNQMGRTRTKYGTKDELLLAVNALHDQGIKVIADIVMNHIMGAYTPQKVPYSFGFEVAEDDSIYVTTNGTVDAYTYFDFNNPNDVNPRGDRYSNFHWNTEHFDGLESYDTYYLFRNKQIDKISELGDLETLPDQYQEVYKFLRGDIILGLDFDFQNPEVQDEMINWTKWLVAEVGFDGFRVDALRHIDIPFVAKWANEIREYMYDIGKGDDLLMFGEFWDGWAERLNSYLEGNPYSNDLFYNEGQGSYDYCGINGEMDLFDVPLHFDFQKIAKQNFSYPPTRIIDLPERGLLAQNPTRAITFVDNHDTVPTQELESYIPIHTKIQAYTYILLHEFGIPTVFYRDMYKGNFVSEYENDNYEYLHDNIQRLVEIRKEKAYGPGTFYRDYNKPGILGYKRLGDYEHPYSGLIYLIREFDSYDNGLQIPTEGQNWRLVMGDGNIDNGTFYLNNDADFAVWIRAEN